MMITSHVRNRKKNIPYSETPIKFEEDINMSKENIEEIMDEEVVKETVDNGEEVVYVETEIEEVPEKLVFGKFKKSTLIKVGAGVAVLAGGLYIIDKIKNSEYDVVEEAIEKGEELVGE